MGEHDDTVRALLLEYIEHTSDLVGVVDENSRVVYLNTAARKRLGLGDADRLTTADLFPPTVFPRYYDEIRPALVARRHWRGRVPLLAEGGEAIEMDLTIVASVGPAGHVDALITHAREVVLDDPPPAPVVPEGALTYDELTQLPQRSLFDDRLRVALARGTRGRHHIAIIFADVDGMKDINDTFGHAVGDDVLRVLALRMQSSVRAGDTVARFGGDEFVLLLDEVDTPDTAMLLVERVRDSVCHIAIATREGELSVSASFGLVLGGAGDHPDELLRRADAAMYQAKARGGAHILTFDSEHEMTMATLAQQFAVAVSHGLMRPYVQPVIDLRSRALVGFQGYARWDRGAEGVLDAGEFIDLVAGSSIASVVDLDVLRGTAAVVARTDGPGPALQAYGHVSRRLIGDVHFERYLAEILDNASLSGSNLCIEIAHALVVRRSGTVRAALNAARALGVRTVLTDLDRGSEVQDIVELGFDELRLSRRLVHDAAVVPGRARALRATVAMGHALDLPVIAVGVETQRQLAEVVDAGCDFGQGRLFGHVVPAGAGFEARP